MHEASIALGIHLCFVLSPKSGGITTLRVAIGVPCGPFDLKNATIRDILNQIVSQHSNGAWVVQTAPKPLRNANC
jgi:hypothetical protein